MVPSGGVSYRLVSVGDDYLVVLCPEARAALMAKLRYARAGVKIDIDKEDGWRH